MSFLWIQLAGHKISINKKVDAGKEGHMDKNDSFVTENNPDTGHIEVICEIMCYLLSDMNNCKSEGLTGDSMQYMEVFPQDK
jgi:hypothetical protein